MLEAVFMLGGLGIVVGSVLAVSSRVFYVYIDPQVEAVDEALPGANCGGCGLPGCSANAEAIVAGKASASSCVAGGAELALEIASIMGVTVEAREADIALPGCTYGVADADLKYNYEGVNDCRAAAIINGGMKVCNIGCLGLGSCARACPFDAIQMGKDNLPIVDEKRCTGCGTCERVCPKHIISLSSVTRRILREYTTDDCTTPCQRACPAGIDIQEYIHQIAAGDYHGAVQTIKERNPFPTVIGRICPRPCEDECRRNYVDESVAINFLKRFAADYEKQTDQRILPYKAPESGRRIAVVGGGIEGLATAFFAARLGHAPTVFEATLRLGGLLRSAIAAFRLPAEILDWDIQGVLEMGVTAETGCVLGKDYTIASLLSEGYEALFLASGGWDSRLARMREAGQGGAVESVPNVSLLLDLIQNQDRFVCTSDVAIVGGGRLAGEAAQICKSKGAKQVTILLRESKKESPLTEEDLQKLRGADVNIRYQVGISRIFGEGDHLKGLEWIDLESLTRETLAVQNLILSAGRLPELIFIKSKTEPTETEAPTEAGLLWEGIETYKNPIASGETGWFAKGDSLTDFNAAIKAIGAGRRAAASIHQIMYDIVPALPEKVVTSQSMLQNVDHVKKVVPHARHIMPLCGQRDLALGRELEQGFSEEVARKEAARCLKCGLICYERDQGGLETELCAETS